MANIPVPLRNTRYCVSLPDSILIPKCNCSLYHYTLKGLHCSNLTKKITFQVFAPSERKFIDLSVFVLHAAISVSHSARMIKKSIEVLYF